MNQTGPFDRRHYSYRVSKKRAGGKLKIFKALRTRFNIAFRKYYENRIALPYGIARFISNIAFIQLNAREMVTLAPLPNVADLWVTVSGARPHLSYSVFLTDWQKVELIVELRGFQVRNIGEIVGDWEPVTADDPRVAPLKDLFLACAFWAPLTASYKKDLPSA